MRDCLVVGGATEGGIRGDAVSERCSSQAHNVADLADRMRVGRAHDAGDRTARHAARHADGTGFRRPDQCFCTTLPNRKPGNCVLALSAA